MAETFAELAMEGVPIVTDNYEKVYDPIKDKTKQGINKVRSVRNGQNGGRRSEDEGDEYDRYGPPRRSQTDRRRRSPRDDYRDDYRRPSRSRRGDVVEERYTYSKSNGRARSVGGTRRKGLPMLIPCKRTAQMC